MKILLAVLSIGVALPAYAQVNFGGGFPFPTTQAQYNPHYPACNIRGPGQGPGDPCAGIVLPPMPDPPINTNPTGTHFYNYNGGRTVTCQTFGNQTFCSK